MTTLTIEVSDELMAKLARQERPLQEVVVDLLEDAFSNGLDAESATELSKEEVIRHLYQMGFLLDVDSTDDPIADKWDGLSDEEKRSHLQEVSELVMLDSPLSRYIIENRR